MTARTFWFPRPMGVPDAPRFAERTPAEDARREDMTWPPDCERQRAALATTLRQLANTLETSETSRETSALYAQGMDAMDDLARLSDVLTREGR